MTQSSAQTIRARKADRSRTRILDAAARLFRERGYATVSLRAIAEGAGMQAGSVYYHFDSKEDIVIAVLDIGIELVYDAVKQAVEALPAEASQATVIRTAIRRHLETFLTYSDYTSANVRIFGQVPASVREANLPARRRYESLWDGFLAQARQRGEVRTGVDITAARLLLIGAMNATLEWFDPARGSIETLAERYGEILLHGLLVPEGHRG